MKYRFWLMLFLGLFVAACRDDPPPIDPILMHGGTHNEPAPETKRSGPGPEMEFNSKGDLICKKPITVPCMDDPGRYRITIIDGCEYIEYLPGRSYWFTHKGDCKNPIHQRLPDNIEGESRGKVDAPPRWGTAKPNLEQAPIPDVPVGFIAECWPGGLNSGYALCDHVRRSNRLP